MGPTFWINTIWYIILGIITIVELILVMLKAERRSNAIAFYLTLLGITLNFEMIILIYFKSYSYYPMIIKNPPIQFDNVLAGNLFSQFSISATILLVVIFNLNFYWYLIFAGAYGIIEEFFLAVGVYSHNWYRTWMTVAILPMAFFVAKKMYAKVTHDIKPILYYGYIFTALFPLFIVLLQWPLQLFRIQDFSMLLFPDTIISRHFLALIHFLLIAVCIMFVYFSRVKWLLKFFDLVILYAVYFAGYKLRLVLIGSNLLLPISTLSFIWMYFSIFIMDRLYGNPLRRKNRLSNK